jgi:predicted DsbA family dithiol-disulfide isomerase
MQIDVWSDFACPWCALGLARLDVALAEFEHGDELTVVHRSFELDPRAPARRDMTAAQAVAAKYGMNQASVDAGHARLTAFGAEVGVVFDFDRVQLGNTFDAHRLAQAARGAPYEHAVVRGLFAAYFAEGRRLSDHEVLRDVAAAAGMPAELAVDVLAGDAYGDAARADEAEAAAREVLGVPYFLINGAWPIPGAQDVETMLIILRRAWSRLGH